MSVPEARLRLDWIYGYRGHQCRQNVQYLSSGEIVYFVAAAAVVYDLEKKEQRHFIEHTDDILALAVHPDMKMVATGEIGSSPVVYIWDSESMSIRSVLSGVHSAGISALAFSSSGTLLGSIDLATTSTFCVHDWSKGRLLAKHSMETERVFDIKFKPGDDSSMVTCGVKHINFWKHCGNALQTREGKLMNKAGEIQSQMCVVFGEEDNCYSGTLSGDIYHWCGGELHSIHSNAHVGAVFAMHRSAEGIVSGGKDGTIKLWSSNLTLITTIDLSVTNLTPDQLCLRSVFWHEDHIVVGTKTSCIIDVDVKDRGRPRLVVGGHSEGAMWALATHPKQDVFVTGSDDCTIRVWDAVKHYTSSISTMSDSVRTLAFSPNGQELAAGLKNGDLVLMEFPAMKKIAELIGTGEAIHELKFSPKGDYIAGGYNDGLVLVFSTSTGFAKPLIFRGHTDFITHMDWSEDGEFLFTNAGVSQTKIFSISTSSEVESAPEEAKPSTFTRVIGAEVQGIYPRFMKDVNDVNAIDVDQAASLAVTGDDYGNVKLFKYPCSDPGSRARRYIGHSAHVTNVRFNHSRDTVISIGGEDHAVFQWKVYPGPEVPKGHSQTVDSCDEETDTSDAELDSELEEETQISYERPRYKEDKIKKKGRKKETVARPPAPDGGLMLDFVFGYRGYDARNNIHFTAQKEIVYHVAALGILYNSENHTQRFYNKHTDDILCLALHPMKDYAATGQVGRDPAIHVWDINKTTTISILKGQHQRGVCSVDFSSDGKLLASVGLDDNHTIVIWGWRKGEKLSSVRGNKSRIFSVRWKTGSNDSLVSVGVRHISFWTMKGASLTSKRGVFGKAGKACTMLCCAFSKTGDVSFSGGENGLVYIWQGTQLKKTVEAHKGAIHALCALDKGYVTGGKDGTVCLWDENMEALLKQYTLASFKTENPMLNINPVQAIRGIALGQGKIIVGTRRGNIFEIDKGGEIELLVGGHAEGEVWGLGPHPTEQVYATVSDDKTLKVWDAADKKPVLNKPLPGESRSVCFSNSGNLMAVGYKTGSVEILKTEDYSVMATLKHRKENISDLAFSPNEDKYLAVASHDNFVDVYSVPDFKRVCVCKGASSYITHVDWEKTGSLLMTNSGAKEVLFYEIPRGARIPLKTSDIGSQEWGTWTSVLSPQCEGIWPAQSDVTDVNSAHVSHGGNIVATGDDFGFVKLFDFPAVQKNAKCKKYAGHSAHVTNVRWTKDDNFLVTTGGGDTSVMLWSHRGLFSSNGESDESESEVEEDGYDSDVEFECSIDYNLKTYSNPIRIAGDGVRPDLKSTTYTADTKICRQQTSDCNVVRRKTSRDVNSLKLKHVFGYRGYDARHNIHFLEKESEVVYHAAGLGIVTNLETKEQRFYTEHTDDILCLSVNKHPKFKNIVATGQLGKQAQVLVWNAETLQTLSILQGFHSRGVCTVNFSSSGKLLVSAGLDELHSMAIWCWGDGTCLARVQNTALRVLHCEFRPDSDSQLVSVGQKHVNFWTLAGTDIISRKGKIPESLGVKMQTMLSVAFSTAGITYTGAISGSVYVWQDCTLARVIASCHSGPVFSLYTTIKDGLIVSGGKEKTGKCVVKLWDQAMKRSKTFPIDSAAPNGVVKSLSRIRGCIAIGTSKGEILTVNERSGHVTVIIQSHGSGEVWGLAVHPNKQIAATASSDKSVRLWDLAGPAMEGAVTIKSAALCADFHPNGSHLAVGCLDGSVLVLSPNLQQVHSIRDNCKQVQVVRFSPDGKVLAVGSDDAAVSLYSVTPVSTSYTRISVCKNLPGSVIQMDWSADSLNLVVSLSTYETVYIKSPEGYKSDSPPPNLLLHSSTGVLGDSLVGIWPKDSSKFDVNSASVANGSNIVATGDDFGTVKLFEYPSREKYAKHKKYFGHSAHVVGVRFTHNDKYLVSIGGEDSCVFVWETDV